MADGVDRATASGERMGDDIRDALAVRGLLQPGDISISWVVPVLITRIDDAGRLCRRTVTLCMRDIDPADHATLTAMQASEQHRP